MMDSWKRWTLTFRGHTIALRKEADKVVDKFKQVGDIVVNADPIHAGLPWAGIRLLLEVGTSRQRLARHIHIPFRLLSDNLCRQLYPRVSKWPPFWLDFRMRSSW